MSFRGGQVGGVRISKDSAINNNTLHIRGEGICICINTYKGSLKLII